MITVDGQISVEAFVQSFGYVLYFWDEGVLLWSDVLFETQKGDLVICRSYILLWNIWIFFIFHGLATPQSYIPYDHIGFNRSLCRIILLFRLMCLDVQEWSQLTGLVVQGDSLGMDVLSPDQSMGHTKPQLANMCAAQIGRLLRIMVGQFLGLRVKVQ